MTTPDSDALEEIVHDAQAYLRIGDAANAVAVLFEGYREHASAHVRQSLEVAAAHLSHSLWDAHNFDGGRTAARAAVDEIQKLTGKRVDPRFAEIYATALAETGASPFPMRRLYRHQNLLHVFRRVAGTPGAIAECGCARGLSTVELCLAEREDRPQWQGEDFHVFDSFAGLSTPTAHDTVDPSSPGGADIALNMAPGRFAVPLEVVARNVHRLFPRVELHAGWIPAVFSDQPERTYRFVHVDVDLYEPTHESLAYFFPRLRAGGVILTDDYNWPGARKAYQEYAAENGLELHTTGTDQAYFVKPQSPPQ